MPRDDEGERAGWRVCRAWIAGSCEFGDSCMFPHALEPRGPKRETIGSRAVAAQGAALWSDADSDHGSSSSSYGRCSSSTSRGRSWADLSEDTWPEEGPPPPGSMAANAAGHLGRAPPRVFEVSGWQLPGFNDRLSFPEFFPSAGPPEHGTEKAFQSKTARRRKQRELADKRAEFKDSNQERADRAVAAALAFKPYSVARPQLHLDFPRAEAASPTRSPAPYPTPRPADRPNYKAHDGARKEQEEEDEEDEEAKEHQPGPARPGSSKISL